MSRCQANFGRKTSRANRCFVAAAQQNPASCIGLAECWKQLGGEMAMISIRTKEPREQGNISRATPSLPLTNEQQDSRYLITLVEATRERRLAALRISELSKKAEGKLFLSV
jgi:hypothetical protein